MEKGDGDGERPGGAGAHCGAQEELGRARRQRRQQAGVEWTGPARLGLCCRPGEQRGENRSVERLAAGVLLSDRKSVV